MGTITHFAQQVTRQTNSDGTTSTLITDPMDAVSETEPLTDEQRKNILRDAMVEAWHLTAATETQIIPPAAYILPGQSVVGSYGEVVSVRTTDGALFRNGVRLGNNACAKAIAYGGDTFMQGHDGRWWQWDNGWTLLTGVHELDPDIFK